MPETTVTTLAHLTPDAKNANRGTPRGGAMIERSLRECGAGRSILLDRNGRIIAGNKTVENAALARIEDVVVVESDGTRLIAVQRTDLDLDTDMRAKQLAVFDNRTAEVNLDWGVEVLEALADEGVELSAMFSDAELAALAAGAEGSAEAGAALESPDEFNSVDETLATDYRCPKCGFEWSGKPK